MDYQVVLSDFFIADLKEIVDYITRRASAEIGFRISNELINRALEIVAIPLLDK